MIISSKKAFKFNEKLISNKRAINKGEAYYNPEAHLTFGNGIFIYCLIFFFSYSRILESFNIIKRK